MNDIRMNCPIFEVKTTVLNKFTPIYSSIQTIQLQYGCMCACYVKCTEYTSTYIVYQVGSYVDSNSVLVIADYTTFAVSMNCTII